MQIYHRLTLDCKKQGRQATVQIAGGDANSHILHISFCLGASPLTFSGSEYATLYAVKPDGTKLLIACTLYGENSPHPSTVSVVIPGSLSAAPGTVKCRITIGDSISAYSSPEFALRVEENTLTELDLSESTDYTALVSLAASARESALVAEGWAKGTQNSVAVGSSSPYYKKNAKYYAEKCEESVIEIDGQVSESSENAVQSKAVKSYVDSKVSSAVNSAVLSLLAASL